MAPYPLQKYLTICAAAGACLLCFPAQSNELDDMLEAMLSPEITPAPGFSAEMLVGPGELYDPLVMRAVGDAVWLNDDGKEEGSKGSRMIAVGARGTVKVLVDADKMVPISAGFDVAPAYFGRYSGHIFALSQPRVGDQGGLENYVIQRIDPESDFSVSVFCTLPAIEADRASAIGVDASFAPQGSPFGPYLYASTTLNGTIYRVGADGSCTPFTTFDPEQHGGPLYQRFDTDGQSLLVTVVRGGIFNARGAAVLRVRPDGTIDDRAVVEGGTMFGGLDIAPAYFGPYAGQLFVVDVGYYEIPVPLSQPLRPDGGVYRVDEHGTLQLVASGFINPWGVRFVDGRLWVSDINGDFIYGKRELPDGFIVRIAADP